MSKQRKYILIAAAAGLISVSLPWITVGAFGISNSVNGFRSYGIAVFIAFAVPLTGNRRRRSVPPKAIDRLFYSAAAGRGAEIVCAKG